MLSLTATTDQALTAECFERLAPQMTAKGWKVSNASVLTFTTGVEDNLLIPPITLVSELQAWASEVASTVVEAIDGLYELFEGAENAHKAFNARATPPGSEVLVSDALAKDASNDDRIETAIESRGLDASEDGEGSIDMTECLAWMGDTIQSYLDGAQETPPRGEGT